MSTRVAATLSPSWRTVPGCALPPAWDISYHSLWRHWARHLNPEQKDRFKFGDACVHRLNGMVADAEISVLKDLNFARRSLLDALVTTPGVDSHAISALTGRLHENARIRGQISGELAKSALVTNNTTVFMQSGVATEFLTDLAKQLRPFPDALRAVVGWMDSRNAAALPPIEHQAA